MDFDLSPSQQSWKERALSLVNEPPGDSEPRDLIQRAARLGLIDSAASLADLAAAVEAMGGESAASAIAFAMHAAAVLAGVDDNRLVRGDIVAAISLSSEQVPVEEDGRLSGRAWWVGPATEHGVAIIGARRGAELVACVASLEPPAARLEFVQAAALKGFPCAHVTFESTPCRIIGSPRPIMARVRVLLAAVGLGMGRRALREALLAARAYSHAGAAGEQTVQGLLADAATELDAAALLTWKAAESHPLSLAEASMAKLAVTEATQRAVARATQVVGSETFRGGHVVERLAQDVRALELFAGRTEALREAVADEVLPRP